MAQITINEISKNYTYNIGANSFCTVALPIASCWGPGYVPSEFYVKNGENLDGTQNDEASVIDQDRVDATTWENFPATQAGLESFVSTYRGPAANYRMAKDFSYYMAVTLLTAGYDVLVCRLCPGSAASGMLKFEGDHKQLNISAKYPGSFGNNLRVKLTKLTYGDYWNLVVYIRDSSGVEVSAENIVFAFEEETAEKYGISHIDEVDSKFVVLNAQGDIEDATAKIDGSNSVILTSGSDIPADAAKDPGRDALKLAMARYNLTSAEDFNKTTYTTKIQGLETLLECKHLDTKNGCITQYYLYMTSYLIS